MITLPRFLSRFVKRTPDEWDDFWYGRLGMPTAAGVHVTEESALAFSAVYACVKVLAESVSSLPLPVYRKMPKGGKDRATDHPLYALLHDQPNPEMTSKQYRSAVVTSMALWGNSYSFIDRSVLGEVRALWPLDPSRIQVTRARETGALQYEWRPVKGEKRVFAADEILHPRLFSVPGLVGLSPIAQAREAIAMGLAEQEYGARLFSNDARPSGILQHPGQLKEEGREHLRRSWNAIHQGPKNAGNVAILEEKMEWKAVAMPAKDAQFLESRKFSVNEICRFYRMPPHMIQDLERATFSNVESQSLEFVKYTLMPWNVEIEQEINSKLLKPKEKGVIFAEFLVDGLLRGDIKARYDAYAVAIQNGFMCPDDARERENMNPIPDGRGQIFLQPMNFVPLGTLPQQTQKTEESDEPELDRAEKLRLLKRGQQS